MVQRPLPQASPVRLCWRSQCIRTGPKRYGIATAGSLAAGPHGPVALGNLVSSLIRLRGDSFRQRCVERP